MPRGVGWGQRSERTTVLTPVAGRLAETSCPARSRLAREAAPGVRRVASCSVNERGVARARQLIEARQYVPRSEWNQVQPRGA
jgi:hypothetical protein